MVILLVKNVSKSFVEGVKVLDNVSVDIEKGDFVSIVGQSGSGKSTLLTIMGGIDRPSSGSVTIDGKDITEMSEKELAVLRRTKVGFVFQFFNLAPYLTVRENIMLPLILGGKVTKEQEIEIDKIMERVGISQYADRLPSKLSGGEQQRVAIARGLIFSPEIIFLDEPTGNLDSKTGVEIMELLKSINQNIGTTIIQVTHSTSYAEYGNKIITIKDGKII